MLNEQPIPMLKQRSREQYPGFMPTVDGEHGAGVSAFDTEGSAEAGLKALLNGPPTEAPPVVSRLVYEMAAEG